MKFKNLSIMTTKLKLLLELHSKGVSQRRISTHLKLSRTSVKNYLTRLLESGKSLEELQKLSNDELLAISCKETYKQTPDHRFSILEPLLPKYSKELGRRYVTAQLLWEEYRQDYGIDDTYSYTTFKHHLKEYVKSSTYKYHNEHQPADVLQVDFAGDKLYLTDRDTGTKIAVDVLCCTLPCSSYSYVSAMLDSCSDNLFNGISKALDYIGGVPHKILSDNMRQWVKKREKNEPVFTDAALEFGFHYSTIIDATGVKKPKHKASVEAHVHQSYTRVYAKIRDEVFYTLNELNARLLELVDEFNDRQMQGKDYSRAEYFETNEKQYLEPLPDTLFKLKYTKRCKVGSNYHIYINTHQYSIPYEYVNKEITAIYDIDTVEIYDMQFLRIAVHKRSLVRYGYTTIKDHMPPAHQAYEKRKGVKNAVTYLSRAETIDSSVKDVLQMILDSTNYLEQAYNSCESILQLNKLHSEELILSCRYIIDNNIAISRYSSLKKVLDTKIYNKKIINAIADQFKHANLRGEKEFEN